MQILIVAQHVNFFRNLDPVLRSLCARGHSVTFLHGTRFDDPQLTATLERKQKLAVFMGRGLKEAEAEVTGVTSGYRPEPSERPQRILGIGRQVVSRAIYFRPGHPSPERVTARLEKALPPHVVEMMDKPRWKSILASPRVLQMWRAIEAAAPPSPTLVETLQSIRPDVMVVAPTVWPKVPVESDYFRAAKSLGIPTVGYVNSWDNMTSKGTVHVVPDVYIVWNEPIAEECVTLHDIPPGIIRITGAPHVDRVFTMRPTLDAAAQRRAMGEDSEREYVLFLCSSRTLIASETELVVRIADALSRRFGSAAPRLVVRPHPTNPEIWSTFVHPGVLIHPKQGDQADSEQSWQDYYNQLAHAVCVFGLNTTAFLEAVVVDCPCLTLVTDEFWDVQGRTGHFRHLLKGDFMEVSTSVDEIASRVGRLLNGTDEKRHGREEFRRWFLRPCGVDRPAGPIVADVIERAGWGVPGDRRQGRPLDLVPGLALTTPGIQR